MTIEEGNWKSIAREFAYGKTSGKYSEVKHQIGVLVEFVEGPSAGSMLTWYGYFNTDDNFDRTCEALETMGWDGKDLNALTGLGTKEFYAVVAYEQDLQGEMRPRIKWINSTAGGVALSNRLDAGEQASFASQMRGRLAARAQRMGGGAPAPAPAQQQRPTAAPSRGPTPGAGRAAPPKQATRVTEVPLDDDIPF